jgi:hypothetical protein
MKVVLIYLKKGMMEHRNVHKLTANTRTSPKLFKALW